jgi:hypothetical protein
MMGGAAAWLLLALSVGTIAYVTVFGGHWPWPH